LSFLDDFFLGGNKAKEGRKEGRKGICCCCCIIMEQSLFLVATDWGQRRGEERRFYTSLANLELLLLLLMIGRCEKLAMDCGELPLLCWFVKAAFS
jgi:hypothetical protein